jgi:hypothetical protein
MELLGNHGTIISDTNRMHKRLFTPLQLLSWLPLPKIIYPVPYDGMVYCRIDEPIPKVYVHAAFESLQVKMEKKSLLLHLIFRTFMVETDNVDYSKLDGCENVTETVKQIQQQAERHYSH